ncbi:MAG: RHS repeat-associated core domain-containing protein, partial [Saprospiraceae bacterium]
GKEQLLSGIYDFGARMYDPVLGRWSAVDLMADHSQQVPWSPYVYGNNNPVKMIDPDGNFPIIPALIVGVALFLNAQPVNAPSGSHEDAVAFKEAIDGYGHNVVSALIPGGQQTTGAKVALEAVKKVVVRSATKTATNIVSQKAGKDKIKEIRRATGEHSKMRPSTQNKHEQANTRRSKEQTAADKKYSQTKSTKEKKSNNEKKAENREYYKKGPKEN